MILSKDVQPDPHSTYLRCFELCRAGIVTLAMRLLTVLLCSRRNDEAAVITVWQSQGNVPWTHCRTECSQHCRHLSHWTLRFVCRPFPGRPGQINSCQKCMHDFGNSEKIYGKNNCVGVYSPF